MKKTMLTFILFTLLVISFSACQNPAGANGTSGYVASSSGSGGWVICKNTSYDIFDIQVWGDKAGTFDYDSSTGRFTATSKGGGWIGGGLVSNIQGTTFDMTGVSKMKFEIRGNINTKALCIGVQIGTENIFPSKTPLSSSAGLASLSKTEWKSVELNVSSASSAEVINAFMILFAPDWGGTFAVNDYFEIRNLDWVDNSGNSITLTLK